MDYVGHLREYGYAIVRGIYTHAEVLEISAEMDRLKTEARRYHASHREHNIVHVIRPHPELGRHLRFIHWPAYISPILARYRIDLRQLDLLKPLLGDSLKQIINQASWKTPDSEDTTFGFHQDARFRRPASAFRDLATSYVQMMMAIDSHRTDNGCLKIFPGSHKLGHLHLPTDCSVMDAGYNVDGLREHGLQAEQLVDILLEPGDVVLFLPYTVHASAANLSNTDRRAYINGYVKAANSDRGEWAFRNGVPCELGKPVLVQYEELYSRPEPHYIEGAIYPFKDD